MKRLNKIIYTVCLMSLLSVFAFAESDGEKAFKNNNPSLAVVLLEQEIEAGTASVSAYNYLGLSYYQLGDYEKSVESFAKGLAVTGTNKKILAYNQGNSYYAMQDFENAAKAYSLTLTADPKYTKALLNRANAYLMSKDYTNAILDYEKFIIMEPQDEQRPQIEELLALLKKEKARIEEEERIAAAEAARIAEEEARMREEMERQRLEQERLEEEARLERERIAEEERIAREKEEAERQAAEAERRRKLLEDVANSLQDTDSANMSAGAGDLLDFEYESELD